MKPGYIKILFLFLSFILFVVITSSIEENLFGANKNVKKEVVSAEAKQKINKIFYLEKASKIDSIMHQKAKKYYFNGNVLVACKGICIYNKSFGYADLRRKKQLKPDDIFQLASVSKQFTAMAIMILKEKEFLQYDDTVTKYIEEFPYPEITIRMLLNHSSGLPNYYWLVEHHWKKQEAPDNADVISLMAEHKLPLYFTPGRRWDYSNAGYVVLAGLVEKISGKIFPDFMYENVFKPLGMKNSFVYSRTLNNAKKDRLTGYYYRGRRYRMIPETINDGTVGDKGVYSTTEDLFKWDQALYNNKLVSEETMQEAISTFKLKNKYEMPYGFGFRIKKRNNKKIAYHHGKWNGFRTSLFRYVEDSNTVIVLNHTSSSLNNSIIKEIQQVLDDTLNIATQKIVNSILDEGVNYTVDFYKKNYNNKNIKLDTRKLTQAEKILNTTNYKETAEKIMLFRNMYSRGELDKHKILNEKRYLDLKYKH